MHECSLLFIFFLELVFISCSTFTRVDIEFWEEKAESNLKRKLENYKNEHNGILPKNIIFFLGDGMGLSAVTGTRTYKSQKKGIDQTIDPLFFETFPHAALIKTSSFNKHVTDSAAGAMALFGGRKVFQNTLGTLPREEYSFEDLPGCTNNTATYVNDGIAELAMEKGLSAGFVTTTPITHATPAALYAKGMNRFVEFDDQILTKKLRSCEGLDIAQQLVKHPANKLKVLMGGGFGILTEKEKGGLRSDRRNILNDWKSLEGKRTIVTNPNELDKLNVEESEHVMGVFSHKYFPYYLDESSKGHKTVPRLSEMTEKAIRVMENNNENGYFLMIEGGFEYSSKLIKMFCIYSRGGMIDQAEHYNKLKQSFEEVMEMDEAIKVARSMTNSSETLIIVTADHSHALSMPGYLSKKHGIFENSRDHNQKKDDPRKIPGFLFASGPGADTPLNYTVKDSESTDFVSPALIYARKGVHGGEDVGLWADGPYAWLFGGTMDNTEVAFFMKTLLKLGKNKENIIMKSRSSTKQRMFPVEENSSWKTALVETVGEEHMWNILLSSIFISFVCIFISIFSLCSILTVKRKKSLASEKV